MVEENNLSEGVKYIKKGADLEDMNCMYYYGHCLLDGQKGVQQNKAVGIELLKKQSIKVTWKLCIY